MEFAKYQHIERYGTMEVEGIAIGTCHIFPKIDGCFDYKTPILLADGTTREIGSIVNQKQSLKVLSYNMDTQQIEKNKIVNWYKSDSTKEDWITLIVCRNNGGLYRGGGRNHQLLCTKNHKIIVDPANKIEVDASTLKIGDMLFVPQYKPTGIQKQIILGTLLGDGFASPNKLFHGNNGINFSHSIKQKKYLDYKIKLLGSLYNSTRKLTSGYGSEMLCVSSHCTKITEQLYQICYKEEKKTVNQTWLLNLNSMGIAIWFMDDGTLSGNRAKLSIEGFSISEQELIKSFFINRGNQCYLQHDGRNHNILVFSPEGTINLFFDICNHIIPSMQYKLLDNFKNKYTPFDLSEEHQLGLFQRKIMNIKKGKKDCYYDQSQFKYDIEIENSHTYFASNVLVHNSAGQIFIDNDQAKAGSRNRVLSLDNDNAGFFNSVITDSRFNGMAKCLAENPDLKFFGEWLVPHSLKTYKDSAWRKFYVYDVLKQEGDNFRYLPYNVYKEICDKYEIEYIPCQKIIKNPTYEDLLYEVKQNHYLMSEENLIGEGIVVKNYDFVNKYGRNTFAKIVTSEFKEKHYKLMGTPEKENKMLEDGIVETYCTEAFIKKTYAKIVVENEGWSSKKIPHLLSLCFKELVEEETYNIVKKFKFPKVDFKTLNVLVINKIKKTMPELF